MQGRGVESGEQHGLDDDELQFVVRVGGPSPDRLQLCRTAYVLAHVQLVLQPAGVDDFDLAQVVGGAAAVGGGWWPKACACLIRLALESGLDAYWRRVKPEVAQCRTGRTRLLMLRARYGPGPDVARRVHFAWAQPSSRAMHHHRYDAPPTAAELRSLQAQVADLLTRLATAGRPRPGLPPDSYSNSLDV